MAKKTQAGEAGYGRKLFSLVILLLAGCSPAEPVSSSDNGTKIKIIDKVEKLLKNIWINHRIHKPKKEKTSAIVFRYRLLKIL